jgi:hypothetical protein
MLLPPNLVWDNAASISGWDDVGKKAWYLGSVTSSDFGGHSNIETWECPSYYGTYAHTYGFDQSHFSWATAQVNLTTGSEMKFELP